MKKTVILSTKPPYGSAINGEGFRAALGLAFSELDVDIILMCDGVYAALKGQNPAVLGMTSLADAYAGAADMNIKVFIDADSAASRGLKADDLLDLHQVTATELSAKIDAADAVLTF